MAGVRAPTQNRSQQTLDRLLDATEELLNDRPWPEITVQHIVAQARSSVGSFYARFEDKNVLLTCLSERLSEHAAREAELMFKSRGDMTTSEFLHHALTRLIRFHRARRGLIRTLTLVPRLSSDRQLQVHGGQNAGIFQALASQLEHPDKTRASLAMFMVVTAIREKIVFPRTSGPLLRISDRRFADELTRAVTAYLGDQRP